MPVFEEQLMYGAISLILHNPVLDVVIVSDRASTAYKRFFEKLAAQKKKQFKEFSEFAAAAYEP